MASLADTLRARRQGNQSLVRGPGGTLTEETPESIQQLTGQKGLSAPPTTPLGAAMIGAGPHQQKMAGTPAQKEAALTQAQKPVEDTLAGAIRRQQPRSEATGQEQATIEKSQDMMNLGSLGQKVQGFVDTQRQILAEQQTPVQVQAAGQYQGQDLSQIKDVLAKFRQNPNDMQALLQINQFLGRSQNSVLAPEEVNQLYQDSISAIAAGGAQAISDRLTVSDLASQPDFGYDLQQLSDLLGRPKENLAGMSVAELTAEVNRVADEEFSKTQQLEQQAMSGQLGQAERGLARGAAREMSRTGMRSSEADISNLEGQIANADQVQFGGQSYRVDDLLRDETISGIISTYLNSAPGSPERQRLEATEPGLIGFIKKNEALLEDASKGMQAGASEFKSIQESNSQIGNVGGIKLDEDLLQAIIPNYGQLSASRVDPNSVPILSYASGLSPDKQRDLATELQDVDPAMAKELAGLDPQVLAKWNIGSDSNSPWQKRKALIQKARELETITNPDEILKNVTSDVRDMDDLTKRVRDNDILTQMGLKSQLNLEGMVTPTQYGTVLKQPEDLKKSLVQISVPSLAAGPEAMQEPKARKVGTPQAPSGVQGQIFKKLSQGDGTPGAANYDVYSTMKKTGFTWDEAQALSQMPGNKFDKGSIEKFMKEKSVEKANQLTLEAFEKAGGPGGDPWVRLKELERINPGGEVDPDTISSRIKPLKELQNQRNQLTEKYKEITEAKMKEHNMDRASAKIYADRLSNIQNQIRAVDEKAKRA